MHNAPRLVKLTFIHLVTHSFARLENRQLTFDPCYSYATNFGLQRFLEMEDFLLFFINLISRIRIMPGVTSSVAADG